MPLEIASIPVVLVLCWVAVGTWAWAAQASPGNTMVRVLHCQSKPLLGSSLGGAMRLAALCLRVVETYVPLCARVLAGRGHGRQVNRRTRLLVHFLSHQTVLQMCWWDRTMLSPVVTGVHRAECMGPTWKIGQGRWVEIRSHYTVNASETSMRTTMCAWMVGSSDV
jgi:hypothetical protein